MMATLEQLLAFRDRLHGARFNGTRAVQDSDGSRIEYRSDSEMAAALAALDREIASVNGRPKSTIHFSTSKGF